jgi:hypothetical protein
MTAPDQPTGQDPTLQRLRDQAQSIDQDNGAAPSTTTSSDGAGPEAGPMQQLDPMMLAKSRNAAIMLMVMVREAVIFTLDVESPRATLGGPRLEHCAREIAAADVMTGGKLAAIFDRGGPWAQCLVACGGVFIEAFRGVTDELKAKKRAEGPTEAAPGAAVPSAPPAPQA